MYGTGINLAGELVDLGSQHGLLEKSGAWFLLDGERIGQGRERACAFLKEHPEILTALKDRLLSAMKDAAEAPRLPVPESEEAAA